MSGIFNATIFNNAIFNTGDGPIPPPVVVGTGAGPGWPIDLSWFDEADKGRRKRWKREQELKDDLRRLLRKAFGLDPVPLPPSIAGEVREVSAPFVEARKATYSKPARLEVDWEGMQASMAILVQLLDRYEQTLEADNDDDDFMVLM